MSTKHINFKFSDVKNQTLGNIYKREKASILDVFVTDEEYDDQYRIRLQRSNRGLDGMCFLDDHASRQADFTSGAHLKLSAVINSIAGGTVIHDEESPS